MSCVLVITGADDFTDELVFAVECCCEEEAEEASALAPGASEDETAEPVFEEVFFEEATEDF